MSSPGHKEIEVKLHISEPRRARILLESLGFTRIDECIEEDYYFNHPCRDFVETDEALRLRKRICSSSKSYVVTYKGHRENTSSQLKIREELELYLSEEGFPKIYHILEKLGFKTTMVFTKTREIYAGKGVKASIDTLHGVGYYLELELDVNGDPVQFEEIVRKVLSELNATLIEKTYLEICLETGRCVKPQHLI